MVDPLFSGVAFSCDPINSDSKVVYIEAINGLGEHLVQGEEGASIKVWIEKISKTVLRLDYIHFQKIPESVLESCIIELVNQVVKIEELFDTPQDVEWAVDSKYRVWILQSRPITSSTLSKPVVPTYSLPGKPYTGWSILEIKTFQYWDEYNSLAIYPLEWDLYEKYLFHINLRMLSSDKNISNFICFYRSVPICIDPKGRITSNDTVNYDISPISNWDETLKNWEIKKANYSTKVKNCNGSIVSWLNLLVSISSDYAKMRSERMLSMIWIDKLNTAKNAIIDFIKGKLPSGEVKFIFDGLSYHIQHETYLMDKLIYEIQIKFYNSESLDLSKLKMFFEKYGHIRYDNVSLIENKDVFVSDFFSTSTKPPNNQFELSRKRYNDAVSKIKSLNPNKEVMEAVQDYRYWLCIRKTTKTKQDLLFPLINRVILKIANLLNLTVDKIKLLTLSELHGLVVDNKEPSVEVLDRKKVVNWKKNNSWLPDSFLPTPYTKESIIIKGDGCSDGEVEKPVKVLKSIEDFTKINNHEIAVVYKTDPSWTPIFSKISGIIVEKGSRLSHAAIVAREMNIPAIVGINGITKLVSDGEIVYMNGQTGLIKRFKKS